VKNGSFDQYQQPADGIAVGQLTEYYEAFWSNLFLRLEEKLKNEGRSRLSVVNVENKHDPSLN
jgi:hypothetical protein